LLWDGRLTLEEVKNRSYVPDEETESEVLCKLSNAEEVLPVVKEQYAYEENRRQMIQDKIKNLLTISSVLLPLCVTITPRLDGTGWIVLPLVLFLVTIYLLFASFGIDRHSVPSLPEALLKEGKGFDAELAGSIYRAAHINHSSVSFLADMYRAARVTFGIGLVVFVTLASIALWRAPKQTTTRLQSNASDPLHVSVSGIPAPTPTTISPTINVPPLNVPQPVVNATVVLT
jgi:hypothetical protein